MGLTCAKYTACRPLLPSKPPGTGPPSLTAGPRTSQARHGRALSHCRFSRCFCAKKFGRILAPA